MDYEIRNIHRQNEWDFLLGIFLEHTELFGLDLRGRSKIATFCGWVSSTIKHRRLGADAVVESSDAQQAPEHITEDGKKCLNSVLIQEMYPLMYNLFSESGVDEFVKDLETALVTQYEERSVQELKDVIADYRVFYHLDIHDRYAVKHFTDWFAENVGEIRKIEEMA